MPTHIILHPRKRRWLTHVVARNHQVHREVLDPHLHLILIEQDAEADGEDADAEDAEGVAVAQLIGGEGDADAEDGGDDEDGDRADLSADGPVAHLGENRGGEELLARQRSIESSAGNTSSRQQMQYSPK